MLYKGSDPLRVLTCADHTVKGDIFIDDVSFPSEDLLLIERERITLRCHRGGRVHISRCRGRQCNNLI